MARLATAVPITLDNATTKMEMVSGIAIAPLTNRIPKTVQDEVGHQTSRMTMDVYGRALKDPAIRAWAAVHFRFPWDPQLTNNSQEPVESANWWAVLGSNQ